MEITKSFYDNKVIEVVKSIYYLCILMFMFILNTRSISARDEF